MKMKRASWHRMGASSLRRLANESKHAEGHIQKRAQAQVGEKVAATFGWWIGKRI